MNGIVMNNQHFCVIRTSSGRDLIQLLSRFNTFNRVNFPILRGNPCKITESYNSSPRNPTRYKNDQMAAIEIQEIKLEMVLT